MTKTTAHATPLEPAFAPARSTTELVGMFIERRIAETGMRQGDLARLAGLEPNYLSMLKTGEELPLSRIKGLAAALALTHDERFELLHARMVELHGKKTELDVHAVVDWAGELFSPPDDETRLAQLWQAAIRPAPTLLAGMLTEPKTSARVAAFFEALAQERLREEEAAGERAA